MSADELEQYEAEIELALYREYRDVLGMFTHFVETDRRSYLANAVDITTHTPPSGEPFFEVRMTDAWAWDMYRPARFVKSVRVLTFRDVVVEELASPEFPDIPSS